ncbi:MAG: hypothetical protein KKH92_06740 [Firmicutes bacterium]|nr:hypothetical protein [Bacillota bacterium]
MVKKIKFIAISLQVSILILVLIGLQLNRNGQNGIIFFYIGFVMQLIVLITIIFAKIKQQQANKY